MEEKTYLCPCCHRLIPEDELRNIRVISEFNKGYQCPNCCDIIADLDHIQEHEYKGEPIEWERSNEYKLNYNGKAYSAIVTYHGQFDRAKLYENGVLIKTIETDWFLIENLTPIIIERNYLHESKQKQRTFKISANVKNTGIDITITENKLKGE